jgi:hypothetical protein
MVDSFESLPDAVGRSVSGVHPSLLLLRDVKGRWRRGPDEDDRSQAIRPPAGQYLGDFAAHGMPYEDKVLQLQGLDQTLDVVGLGEDAIVIGTAVGPAPAAQVNRDATEAIAEPRDDLGPGSPRAAPVVEEHQSRAAFTLFFRVNLQPPDTNAVAFGAHGITSIADAFSGRRKCACTPLGTRATL